MKKLIIILLLLISASAFAQSIPTVDVRANGSDIRDVLYQLFTQAKKSYVLQPGIREALNLNLVNVEFDEALTIVCEAASLKADLQNGIYYIGRKKTGKVPAPVEKPSAAEGMLDKSELNRRITTKLAKAPIKAVLAELTKQTHVKFELDPAVPAYRLDLFMTKLTLRQALDRLTKAAKLEYELTNRRTIRIRTIDGPLIAKG